MGAKSYTPCFLLSFLNIGSTFAIFTDLESFPLSMRPIISDKKWIIQ